MKKNPRKIIITGHIDHGKSTLIGRLLLDTGSLSKDHMEKLEMDYNLAYLADQLKEEKEQKLTIDTTHIYLKINKRDYILIDSPGHLEFIKNMITGATKAEIAALVVDVTEGVMEQTRRHIYLLNLLGLSLSILPRL